MKKQSTFGYILRLGLTLLAITGIVALALAGVNAVTAPVIAQLNEQKTQQAIEAVLPGGGEKLQDFSDDTGLVAEVYASEIGYAVKVMPQGFGGTIQMMVGIDKEGKVLGIDIISQTETAGLGAIIAAKTQKGVDFRGQYAGLSGTLEVGSDIQAITSATISSKAVTTGVNAALACVEKLG